MHKLKKNRLMNLRNRDEQESILKNSFKGIQRGAEFAIYHFNYKSFHLIPFGLAKNTENQKKLPSLFMLKL